MTIVLVLICGLATVLLGRVLLNRWLNHLSIFSALWTGSLVLLEMRFLKYYELQWETWYLIAAGWASFLLGALVVSLGRKEHTHSQDGTPEALLAYEQRLLIRSVWGLSAVALLATLQHWYVLIDRFGSVPRVLIMANTLYSMRVADELPGMIPYLDSLAHVAVLFAGMITAAAGRLKLASVVPLLIVFLAEMAKMGRAELIIAALLFACGYTAYKIRLGRVKQTPVSVLKKVVSALLVIAIIASGAEAVRSTRGTMETLRGASRALGTLKKSSFVTPTIYLYLTVNHVVFNQYLHEDKEDTPIGANTLAPVYRILGKFGLETESTRYQRFYLTPHPANTGTYLKEFDADFGLAGILVLPFLISAIATRLFLKLQLQFRFLDAVLLGYFFAIVGMSLFYIATRSGGLLMYLLFGTIYAILLDRRVQRKHSELQEA